MTAYQEAISAGIAGADLAAEDQIKVNFTLGGMQGAISANASTPAEDLRAPILDSVHAVLETLSSDRDKQRTTRKAVTRRVRG